MKTLRGYGYDLTVRGLLAQMVDRVVVEPVPCKLDPAYALYEVTLHLLVPDRETGETTDLKFVQEYLIPDDETAAAGTSENAAVLRALRDAWDHEFREGVWFPDGTPAHNPEPDHARG